MSDGLTLDDEAYAEVLRRLGGLRDLAAELADAYDGPVAKQGAGEMLGSIDRVVPASRAPRIDFCRAL
jgi:hypothetical protein